jgi:hypothetical protein
LPGRRRHTIFAVASLAGALALAACGGGINNTKSSTVARSLTGDAWVPNVAGTASSNHDASVTVSRTTLATVTAPIIGRADPMPAAKEVSVSIDMTNDLGAGGSLTLQAEVVDFPSQVLTVGGAYPMLVYLSDGTNDLVNLARTGAGGDCAQSGFESCSGGSCTTNSSCVINSPSAYYDRAHWEDHRGSPSFASYTSTYQFPTCNWGNASAASGPDCKFNSNFFVGGKLRSGVTYTAKYVLRASNYANVSAFGLTAGIKVNVIKKTKASGTVGGAIDVNVIFVGYDNAQASRNAKGKINLDTLMGSLQGFYNQASTAVKLGTIRAFEWTGGDGYADVKLSSLGAMLADSASILPAATDGRAVNVYLVKTIANDSAGADPNLTVLGIAGGITGPAIQGTKSSGVVFSSFNKLDKMNSACSAAPCEVTKQDVDFADLSTTITHEIGHYLGLNHPSEATGATHDLVNDTPICTATGSGGYLTIGSCLNTDANVYPATTKTCNTACTSYSSAAGVFCPTKLECQFNHVMWWSSKNFKENLGTSDGNLFSTQSGVIMNYSPYVQ